MTGDGASPALLARTALFRDLDAHALEQLAGAARRRVYKKGHLLFRQGDEAETLFVLVDGLVKVYVTSEDDGDEMVLVTLRPPDTLGELGLIDGRPRSASAEVLEQSEVLELGRRAFLDLLAESPAMTDSLLRSLGAVLRRLTEQASDLVFLDLHGRVAKLVVGMAVDRGAVTAGACELDVEVTQADLAGMVGGSRQSVNQILGAFERRGYLEMRGRKFLIKDLAGLRRRAGM